jgi:hypothetical protein
MPDNLQWRIIGFRTAGVLLYVTTSREQYLQVDFNILHNE